MENEEQIRQIIRDELQQLIKSDRYTFARTLQILDGRNIICGKSNGTKVATEGGSTGQKLGFWNTTPIVQPTNGADLTNNVTAGGTTDTIANFTDLSTYATDAATIRNDIYQLAKKLKVVNDALRDIGLMS